MAAVAALLLLALAAPPADASSKEFRDAYNAAKAFYDAGDYVAALVAFEKARAIEPAAEALYGIARCHHRLARHAEAAKMYDLFIKAAPDHKGVPAARGYLVEMLRATGAAALARGDHAAARADFERARTLHVLADPSLTDADAGAILAGLGDAFAGLGERERAIAHYGRALGAALPPAERAAVEARLGTLVRPAAPETRPGERGAESAPASVSAPASAAVLVGAARPDGLAPAVPGDLARTALAPLPAPGRRPRALPWILAGGGVVVAGAVAIATAVLLRPAVDQGWFAVDLRP